jgi:ketosteroid isomerase-like protein
MSTHTPAASLFAALICPATLLLAAGAKPEVAIRDTAEAYRKAVIAGDPAAVAATYCRDAVEMPPFQPALRGRPAIELYYRNLFASPMKVAEFEFTGLHVSSSAGVGFVAGAYRRQMRSTSGEVVDDSGNFVVVVRREENAWRSAYVIYNSERPPDSRNRRAAFAPPIPAMLRYYAAVAGRWLLAGFALLCGWIVLRLAARLLRARLRYRSPAIIFRGALARMRGTAPYPDSLARPL